MATCKRRDVPGVLPGVIGTDRTVPWLGWFFVRTSRNPTSGIPFSWHESFCHAAVAENHFEPQNFVAEGFPGGVSSLWQRGRLIKRVPCKLKHTPMATVRVACAQGGLQLCAPAHKLQGLHC